MYTEKRSHYQLKNILGQGGMGVVYLAKDLRLERLVAVKCLKQETQNNNKDDENDSRYLRLRREANTLAQLNHPNIVQIYDIIDDEQGFALVMEYIAGNTLNVQLREHITPFKQRLIWLQQIADGLAAAHSKGLIHRDLKADNILINDQNIAKITDFGIAKNTQNTDIEYKEYTQQGNFVGSYGVLSPEQALGEPLDNRSDLFSFGILAFKLLCGQHPFGNSANHNVLVQNILHQAPLSAKSLNVDLAEGLVQLLNSLLMKNRQHRPENASIVSKQLQVYIDNCQQNNGEPTFAETACIARPQYSTAEPYQRGKTNFIDVQQQASPTSDVQSLKNTTITASNTKKHKGKNVITYALLILLSIMLPTLLYNFWPFNTPPENLYVAVLPPVMNADSPMSAGQQQLLIESFNHTLQQQVISTPGLHLISQQQMNKTSGDYGHRAKALAADILIESILQCEAQRCQVELNRIEAFEGKAVNNTNTEAPWAVKQQQQWPMIVDLHYLSTTIEVRQQLIQLFPGHTNPRQYNPLSETAYQDFLKHRYNIYSNEHYTPETWQSLWQLQGRYQHYLPYYQLMSYLGRMLYDESGDELYLEQLTTLLNAAEQNMGLKIELLEGLFEVALRRQEYKQAKKLIDTMLERGTDKVKVLIKRGLLASFKGNYIQADTLYQQALVLRPSIKLLYRIANNYFYQGNAKDALAALDALSQLNPNYLGSLRLKALIYLYDGQLVNATLLYQKFITENPTSSLYNNLGLIYELQDNYAQAELSFIKAVELSPDNNILRLNLADSLKLQGKITQSTKHYQIIIDSYLTETEDWEDHLAVALAEIQQDNTANALTALHHSLRLTGENAEVIFNAALIYTVAEQWPVALSYVEKSLKLGYANIYFDLPWFDGLCHADASAFNQLLLQFSQNQEGVKSQMRCKK